MSSVIKDGHVFVINPSTLEEIAKIKCSTSSEVEHLISESRSYKKWSVLTLKQRCYYINRLRKTIVKNQDELKQIIKKETGKKDFDILIELFSLLEHLKEISKIARKALRKEPRNTGLMKSKKAYVAYEPLGVAGIIAPWNYPLTTPISSSVEALLAGNNIILKPSEHTPLTSLFIKKLWDQNIGFSNAFNVLIGGGDVGEMIVQSKDIDIICFTGSTNVGKKIAKQCGDMLKPVILELGGKDPMIILEDANINRAVESAIFGGFSNVGQTCISVEEVFIEKPIFNLFVDKISDRVKKMSSGNNDDMDLGAMIMKQNCDKVRAHIDEIDDKDKIIKGSSIDHPMYIAPTIVVDPAEDLRIVNEETFGPIISLRSFIDEKHLLKLVHKTGYGLAGSIFGKNKNRINRILKQLKIGNVSINDVFTHYGIASLPFGGEGLSGLGRLHGKEGLRSLCRTKSVVENRFQFLKEPWWYGRPAFVEKLLNFFLKKYYNI